MQLIGNTDLRQLKQPPTIGQTVHDCYGWCYSSALISNRVVPELGVPPLQSHCRMAVVLPR